ncbi:MAG: hypothetical protein HYT40_01940 [Candidatus Sungbacteria bacterium]|uniref:CYTH domain-containing protein n=1 Tax=Candidatus Sungiibacteriota bacterium TaxID=2750080 RepID=A0A931WPE6_9BACT|nr:hypothetical protein [Candidatus Sungbacteria bacterium]
MKNVEVEISSFVSPAEWDRLRIFFRRRARFVGSHRDATTYFEKNGRLRIRVEPDAAYLVFKSGFMHSPHREEIEISFSKKNAGQLERVLDKMGFPVLIRWF